MKKCIACRSEIDDSAKLCPSCRVRQDASECPVCGNFAKPVPYLRESRHFFVWVVLFFFYIIPGLIWWAFQRKKVCCPNCGHRYG